MRKFFLLIFLITGCSEPIRPPGVYEYCTPRGTANCFVLKANNQYRLITCKHVTMKYSNENFDDIAVLNLEGINKNSYLKPSKIQIPFCTLPNEKPRTNYPIKIIGFYEGKLIETKGYACGHLRGPNVDIIFTTANMYPGMSGSPVLDKNGNVIGIATARLEPKNGYNGKARSKVTPIKRALYRIK